MCYHMIAMIDVIYCRGDKDMEIKNKSAIQLRSIECYGFNTRSYKLYKGYDLVYVLFCSNNTYLLKGDNSKSIFLDSISMTKSKLSISDFICKMYQYSKLFVDVLSESEFSSDLRLFHCLGSSVSQHKTNLGLYAHRVSDLFGLNLFFVPYVPEDCSIRGPDDFMLHYDSILSFESMLFMSNKALNYVDRLFVDSFYPIFGASEKIINLRYSESDLTNKLSPSNL